MCIAHICDLCYNLPVGYSGHETGIPTTVAAAVLGACCVERHITMDRAMWGSDQAASWYRGREQANPAPTSTLDILWHMGLGMNYQAASRWTNEAEASFEIERREARNYILIQVIIGVTR